MTECTYGRRFSIDSRSQGSVGQQVYRCLNTCWRIHLPYGTASSLGSIFLREAHGTCARSLWTCSLHIPGMRIGQFEFCSLLLGSLGRLMVPWTKKARSYLTVLFVRWRGGWYIEIFKCPSSSTVYNKLSIAHYSIPYSYVNLVWCKWISILDLKSLYNIEIPVLQEAVIAS